LNPKQRNLQEAGENCIMESFVIYTLYQLLLGRINQGGACSMNGYMQNMYRILVIQPKGKIPLGKRKHRREAHKEIGNEGVGWIYLAVEIL
jgi:hypothetical protein